MPDAPPHCRTRSYLHPPLRRVSVPQESSTDVIDVRRGLQLCIWRLDQFLLHRIGIECDCGLCYSDVLGECICSYFTVVAWGVTAVCASALPFSTAPVCNAMFFKSKMFPLNVEVVPRVVVPATCQKMFLACAPPARMTFVAELILRVPAIWKIQIAFWLPE